MKDIRGGRNVDESGFPGDTRRRRLGSWRRALAGVCLAAAVIGGPAMVAGGMATGAHALILAAAPSGPCSPLLKSPSPEFCLAAVPHDAQVQLTWTPAVSKNLALYDGTVPDIHKARLVGPVRGRTASVGDLINRTTYYFWLLGNKSNVVSNMASAVPVTVPGAPGGLTATPGNAQVGLSWTAPASDGGSPISGYIIYQGTSPGGETSAPVNGSLITGTSYTVTGLTNGTAYYFTVVAVNAAGQSSPTGEASAVPVTMPGAPGGLTATPGNAQVDLSWTAPASDGGSSVTSYDLYAGTTADLNGSAPIAKVAGSAITVTGLVNGTTYYFRVTAVNQVGEGLATETKAIPVTVPGAPAGLTATPGNSRVTLSWTAPVSGGAAISGYIIYRGTSPGGETGVPVNSSLVTGTSYTVTGLTNGTTYYLRVFAVNALGQSPPSRETSATLPPPITPTAPASAATTPTAPASATTTPTAPASATTPTAPASATTPTAPASGATTPTTPTAPASQATTATASTSAQTFAAPTGLTGTAGNTQVHLSWTAPASDGGSSVVSYKVYITTAPGVQGSRSIGSSQSTGATVTGLPNGIVYYFMVTAVNAAGNESPFSTEVSAEPVQPATGVTVSLDSSAAPPTQLVALLAAVAVMVAAGASTLITRRRRRLRPRKPARPERSRQPMAGPPDVRAIPDTARPDVVRFSFARGAGAAVGSDNRVPSPLACAGRWWPGSLAVRAGGGQGGRCTVVVACRPSSPVALGPFEAGS